MGQRAAHQVGGGKGRQGPGKRHRSEARQRKERARLERSGRSAARCACRAHLKSAATTPANRPDLRKRREKRPEPQDMSTSVSP